MQADAIYDMIGFPDFILDNKELDDVYDGVGGHPACGEGVWSLLTPSPGEPHGGAMSLFGGPIWDRALTEPPWYRAHPGQGGVNHPGGPFIPPLPLQYEVSEDSFFQNMLNFYNFSAKVMADQLRKPPNRDQ